MAPSKQRPLSDLPTDDISRQDELPPDDPVDITPFIDVLQLSALGAYLEKEPERERERQQKLLEGT